MSERVVVGIIYKVYIVQEGLLKDDNKESLEYQGIL